MMKIREKLYQLMAGRYGLDQLGQTLNAITLGLIVLNLLLRSKFLWVLSLAGIIVTWFRILSRDMERRRRENEKYLALRWRLGGKAGNFMDRMKQSRSYVFFHCPECKAMLRVPRGKGRIRVTCRKCGAAFEKRT